MNILSNRYISVSLKLYIAVVLICATVLSPLALSAIPIVILIWYIYLLRWPINSVVVLMTGIFLFFSVTMLFSSQLGPLFSLLIALPVIGMIFLNLEDTATTITYLENEDRKGSRPTSLYMTIIICIGAVFAVAILTGNLALLLASVIMALFFGGLGIVTLRMTPLKPVETELIQSQIIAGNTTRIDIELSVRTTTGGLVFLRSPYEWMNVDPADIMLKGNSLPVILTITPQLSGPSVLRVKAQSVDRWGLFRTWFEIETVSLFVIPRARYAAWLAEKYLKGTSQGSLPLITNLEAPRATYGLRQGIEYYGSQLYQPGDSMKNIDWKHSVKYNELITKEFIEFNGQSAVLLINLSVTDENEADILAYNIIVTALSLARNDIRAALAVYDHNEVKLTTVTLNHQHLVARSLQVAREMVSYINPVRYLNPPDLQRLRNNIRRIGNSKSEASLKLMELLQIELKSLSENAKHHPASEALLEGLSKAENRANIVVISRRNHDAEALAYNTIRYMNRGNAVIEV
ncbi:MAG: DUF58 domain-containing protein [Dehalococcoidales bacterium]|nr:DUF58 domain-containing protein [Dehalococcoidales bacterium]